MIRLQVSYSLKTPGSSQYSSVSYHAGLDVEVADEIARDGRRLEEHLQELWGRLEAAVEAQAQSTGTAAPAPASAAPSSNGALASQKQINYLSLLARRARGWGLPELQREIRSRFGDVGLYELSREQASALIDSLQGGEGRGRPR